MHRQQRDIMTSRRQQRSLDGNSSLEQDNLPDADRQRLNGNLFSPCSGMICYDPANDTTISWAETPGDIERDRERFITYAGGAVEALSPATDALQLQFAAGRNFEAAGLDVIGGEKNTLSFPGPTNSGGWGRTIPDNLDSDMFGFSVTDFKDEVNISYTQQLQIQHSTAQVLEAPWNIVVSPRNQRISEPLWNAVRSAKGNIYVLDPTPINIEVDE